MYSELQLELAGDAHRTILHKFTQLSISNYLYKKPMSKRHFWGKIQTFSMVMNFWKSFFRELSKRHSWKINPDLKSCLDFFSRNDAYSFPKNPFFQKAHKNNWNVPKWIFFPVMTLPDVPKRVWIFFSENEASSVPVFSMHRW